MTEVLERFIRYVKIHTTSKEDVDEIPSTACQFDLANLLVAELKQIGLSDAKVDNHAIVTATLPSNLTKGLNVPVLMFNAHLDTSPEEPGENVKPQIIKNYQGGNIVLPGDSSVVISPNDSAILRSYQGHDIVTTDGTTLLGADDKAGIAEIMTAIAKLTKDTTRKHGTIKIVFTPDEEVGKGTDALDVAGLGADYGFTLDNDELEVSIETFNAAGGTIAVKGFNIHPGYAYEKMVNAIPIVGQLINLFPPNIAPETTKDYQGYFHLYHVDASVNEAKLRFILRDFDHTELKKKMTVIEEGVKKIQHKNPKAQIVLDMKESYHNMREILDKYPQLSKIMETAVKRTGLPYKLKPIRGGTDGARMCFEGLPTPNLFCGFANAHSKTEFVSVQVMEQAVSTILNIIEIITEIKKLD